MARSSKWLVLGGGSLAVLYSVIMLVFVATSPDLRLRCLLIDDPVDAEAGLVIRSTPNLDYQGPQPEPGDLLLGIGVQPIRSLLDFSAQLMELRSTPTPPGGRVPLNTTRSEYGDLLPWLTEDEEGTRTVEIEFRKPGATTTETSYLIVQSVPFDEVVLTFVWFVLELVIFVVAALAYWHRPFDRSARLFYAMCVVTLGAFVGGYHWWVISGSLLLNVPFIVCAVLLPPVTLHFFLSYPHPKPPLSRWPRVTISALYAIPLVAVVWILAGVTYARWLNSGEKAAEHAAEILNVLSLVRHAIYAYLTLAGLYFLLTLVTLVYSFFTTRNPLEQNQVKWILSAGLIATVPVSYSLYLAYFDRVEFALGSARVPMFLASLCFMLAYAVGIVRYKLMLIDQIVSKGMLYYAVSFGLAIAFSIIVAMSGVLQQLLNVSPSPLQLSAVFAVLMLSVMLLLWLRDQFQQMIDRRFFREKYQLDKALERMNRAVGHLVDPTALADMMLTSCRDVLQVERAALYLRSSRNGPFELVSSEGMENIPLECAASGPFHDALHQSGSLQRVTPESRSRMSPVQNLLRELHADLVHGLEVDGSFVGLVVLSEKKNGASFTAEDLTFLNALGQITNIALHSASVHEDITRLNEELRLKVERISEQRRQIMMLQSELTSTQETHPAPRAMLESSELRRDAIKGNSPAIRSVLEMARKVATSESSVLLRGESGTGKELLARMLHDNSPRSSKELIAVHCASLAPSLLESELFGHMKGAFTGAHRDRIGRFEAANGGTLFLDEIGDMSLETQIKLLRVLQERCFEPVGGTRTIHVDVRLITATHQNLEKLISEGIFREDLYYRLNVVSITLPPLRERKEDMVELAFYFLNRAATRLGKRITHMDEEVLSALEQHSWPGNIRELENAIERAIVLAEDNRITLQDLPAEVGRQRRALPGHVVETKPVAANVPLKSGLAEPPSRELVLHVDPAPEGKLSEDAKREILLNALQAADGNKAEAARMLGLPRSTYFSKLKKYVIG